MNDKELDGIHSYLNTKLCTRLFVSEGEEDGSATVYLDESIVGNVERIEDEGEVEYQFEMKISAEKYPDSQSLESYLCAALNPQIRFQGEEDDHAQIYIQKEFIGLVYKNVGQWQDEHQLQIPILPEDFPE